MPVSVLPNLRAVGLGEQRRRHRVHARAFDPPDQLDSGSDVAPLVTATELQRAAVDADRAPDSPATAAARRRTRCRRCPPRAGCRTTSRASIRLTGKCLPMSRRKSSTDIGPVQSRLLTIRAALSPVKSTNFSTWPRMPLDPAGHGLLAVEHSLAGLLGIADQPGRPADQNQRLVPGSLQDPGHHELHEVAEVHAGSRRVEADIEGDRPGSEMARPAPPRRWTRPAGHATSVRSSTVGPRGSSATSRRRTPLGMSRSDRRRTGSCARMAIWRPRQLLPDTGSACRRGRRGC